MFTQRKLWLALRLDLNLLVLGFAMTQTQIICRDHRWSARSDMLLRPLKSLMMVFAMSTSLLLVCEPRKGKEADCEETQMLLSDFSLESQYVQQRHELRNSVEF